MKVDIGAQFTSACEEYSDALFRYSFFKVSDREVAKDLVQDTYMKAWGYMEKGEEIKNIRALFYKILSNLIIDHYKKKKASSLDKLLEAGFDPGFDDTEQLENRLDGEIAFKQLEYLGEAYRDVIFMRYVEDMSIKEIAQITHESENAVAVKIHRGMKKVKEIFNHKSRQNNDKKKKNKINE